MGKVVETLGKIICKNCEKSFHARWQVGSEEGCKLDCNSVEITGANSEPADGLECLLAPATCGLGSNA